ncbi:hypothetical protein AB691_1364 [Stutzerimonas stutzeri]|nr:hypothetical protein AB691_1364 [Stutzerimonas stutzeri]
MTNPGLADDQADAAAAGVRPLVGSIRTFAASIPIRFCLLQAGGFNEPRGLLRFRL